MLRLVYIFLYSENLGVKKISENNSNPPLISIITATYNRSNVLKFAIQSALHSTIADWELLVIGDACTDDTSEVVAAFKDDRIHFLNLKENFGDQSGPNNIGFKHARGRFIAYLNHDDLYFPDHLESCLGKIEKTGADLIFSAAFWASRQLDEEEKGNDFGNIRLGLTPPGKDFELHHFVPASTWLLRRALIEAVGSWRPARCCYTESSYDFLFRAWKSGKKLLFNPNVSVLIIPSPYRKGSYRDRDMQEHQFYGHKISTIANYRELLLNHCAIQSARRQMRWFQRFYKPMARLGLNPRAMTFFFRYGGKGRFYNRLQQIRGLGKLKL